MAEKGREQTKSRTHPASRLARISRALSVLLKDRNLRSSVRTLLHHFGQSQEVSHREFASSISDWKRNLALIQMYHDSSGTVFSESLVELYPGLVTPMTEEMSRFQEQPAITILTPIFSAKPQLIERTLRSVEQQFYRNLKLCLLTEPSASAQVKESAIAVFGERERVEVIVADDLSHNLSAVLNEALDQCESEFVGFLSAGDRLTRDALFEVVQLINRQPDADLIYSDEEQRSGVHFSRSFNKPGWSPDLFSSINYLQNFLCCRTEAVRRAGCFRGRIESDIKYDLLLRIIEQTQRIHHIPLVLYHEHLPKESLPSQAAQFVFEFQKHALEHHLKRTGIEAEVCDGIFKGSFRVRRRVLSNPKVSIIIPTKDSVQLLRQCIESVETRSAYRNFEIIVVDNASADAETLAYLAALPYQVLRYPGPFNFSAINNQAARTANGSHLLFLNDDTQVIAPDWLEALLEHSQREEVGVVGAKLLYPNGTIQHAGMGLDPRRIALHLNRFRGPWEHGPLGLADVVRNVNAVTGACLMTRASLFNEVGGFNESLPVHYNDVDLCLQMRDRGYLAVYTPFALLYHHEGVRTQMAEIVEIEGSESGRKFTCQVEVPPGHAAEVGLFYSRWRTFIENDEYYVADELS